MVSLYVDTPEFASLPLGPLVGHMSTPQTAQSAGQPEPEKPTNLNPPLCLVCVHIRPHLITSCAHIYRTLFVGGAVARPDDGTLADNGFNGGRPAAAAAGCCVCSTLMFVHSSTS